MKGARGAIKSLEKTSPAMNGTGKVSGVDLKRACPSFQKSLQSSFN